MPNVYEPEWEYEMPGLRAARVGAQAGAERLGAALYEIEPGKRVSPLHIHHANEEMILVVDGRPTLRTAEDERELAAGDVVACPAGPRGAHQVLNRSDAPARVLIVSTMVFPDVAEHLDSKKVLVVTRPLDDPEALAFAFRTGDAVDVMEGEERLDGDSGGVSD